MPKVGEAWYELDARDQRLVSALKGAEGRARTTGKTIEGAVGDGGEAGFGKGAVAAGKFGGAMDTARAKTGRFGGVMQGVGSGIMQGIGVAGFLGVGAAAAGFVSILGKGVSAASDFAETTSKVSVVFGENAAAIRAWAVGSAQSMGLSENAALAAAATYGNLFVALKLPGPAAADMSKSLTALGADLASFNNVPVTDALDALRSGLTGEFESLKRFGINLNEAMIAEKAFALGLIKTTKDAITPAIKAQAIYGVIMDQTATAQGDFARTSSGLANQQKIAAAEVEDAFREMGDAILPIAQAIVPLLAKAFVALIGGISSAVKAIGSFYERTKIVWDIVGALAGLLLDGLVKALEKVAFGFDLVATIVSDSFGTAFAGLKFIVGGIIGTIRNLMDIAAALPGPWQEGAAAISKTLDRMQNDVERWGEATTTGAGKAADDTIAAVAGGLEAGAPEVAAAAATGVTEPISNAATAAKKWATREAAATPQAIADSLRDGGFVVKDAAEHLKDLQKNALSKTKEIAKLEGFLTGSALASALKDKRPEVRAQAEAYKTTAEDRLFALRNNVDNIALKTGQTYADALAAKKAQVASKASVLASAAAGKLREVEHKAELWGQHAGKNWADGLASMRWYAAKAAAELASGARGALEFSVPKEGPLRKMEEWGEHAGQSWAAGLASQVDTVSRAALRLAGGATVLAPGATSTTSNTSNTRSWTGDLRVDLHVGRLDAADPQAIRDLGRMLGDEVRLTLTRGPGLFARDGS